MPKRISKLNNSFFSILIATTICIGIGLANQNRLLAQQATKVIPTAPRLGEFSLRDYDKFQYVNNAKSRMGTFSLTKADVTSPRYDFVANSLKLNIKNGRADNGIATGKVHATVRDLVYDEAKKQLVSKQTIHADCDKATYTATDQKDHSRIDLTGNVVLKVYNDDLAEPLILTGQTGSIQLQGEESTTFTIDKGTASVTPKEPAPPKKK